MSIFEDDDPSLNLSFPLFLSKDEIKKNCQKSYDLEVEKIEKYKQQIIQSAQKPPYDQVIMIVQVDDKYGRVIADTCMPGHDWQKIRSTGAEPYFVGVMKRVAMFKMVDYIDKDSSVKLNNIKNEVPVVIIENGVVEIFTA